MGAPIGVVEIHLQLKIANSQPPPPPPWRIKQGYGRVEDGDGGVLTFDKQHIQNEYGETAFPYTFQQTRHAASCKEKWHTVSSAQGAD